MIKHTSLRMLCSVLITGMLLVPLNPPPAVADMSPFFQMRNDSAGETPEQASTSDRADTDIQSDSPPVSEESKATERTPPEQVNQSDSAESSPSSRTSTRPSRPSESPPADTTEPTTTTEPSSETQEVSTPEPEEPATAETSGAPARKNAEGKNTEKDESTTSSSSATRSGESSEPEPMERALPQRMETRYVQSELLSPIPTSRDTELRISHRADTSPPSSLLAADTTIGPAAADIGNRLAGWTWWLLAGAGLFLLGLFLWMRRRRVKVIETHSLDSYEYFRRKFENQDVVVDESLSEPDTNGSPAEGDRSKPSPGGDSDDRASAVPVWEASDQQLRDAGIEPRYRPIVTMYFEKGYEPGVIVEESEFGPGEVGLVIDLVRRNFHIDRSSTNPS